MSCWRVLEGTVLGRGSVSGYGGEGGGRYWQGVGDQPC